MTFDDHIARCVQLGLMCIPREYPHASQGMLLAADDVQLPRALWPVFYGCYDWHSAVHNHWQLVRALRVMPDANWASDVVGLLDAQFREDSLSREAAYLRRFPTFEMPYGIAWLHTLCAEIDAISRAKNPYASMAQRWARALAPVHAAACENTIRYWKQLVVPNRAGAHANTAFAAGLMLDAARTHATVYSPRIVGAVSLYFDRFVRSAARIDAALEPLGYDFLSPLLCEADVARRLLDAHELGRWLAAACPKIEQLTPPVPEVPEDGQQSHFDGLNLSRAWMLRGIAKALPPDDSRRERLLDVAHVHAAAGLAGTSHEHYSGQHWLGSFAMYLLTHDRPLGENPA